MKLAPAAFRASALVAACLLAQPWAFGGKEARFVRIAPEEVRWTEAEGWGGVKMAVLDGDPAQPGLYVIRVKFPRGVMSRNHYHPEDRHVVVLQGTWYTGEGDAFDPDHTVPLKAGSYMKHPSGARHFDGAKDEEVVVQIVGYGPSRTTWLRPEEGHFGSSVSAR